MFAEEDVEEEADECEEENYLEGEESNNEDEEQMDYYM